MTCDTKNVKISTGTPTSTLDIVRGRLNYFRDLGMSWRQIANLDEYKGIPFGTLDSIAHGLEPKRKHRQQLGLPPVSDVIYLYGYIPTGEAISVGAVLCECGQLFISNHPARKRCFICSPYRRRHGKSK